MLIHGAPGLGKSLMAECLIEAAGVPSFTVRKDKANGAFVDFIRHVFDEAVRSAPSIVYLDGMDKFANADEQHRNAEEFVAVQSCIDSVKGKDVFVLATTNDLDCLPESLYRAGRFDRRVNVGKPDGGEAAESIRHYLAGKRLADDLAYRGGQGDHVAQGLPHRRRFLPALGDRAMLPQGRTARTRAGRENRPPPARGVLG